MLGRSAETRRLNALLAGARNGSGGAVAVLGEPGIGKTEMLNALAADAVGLEVLRVDGYEAESNIPYAALQRMGLLLTGHLDVLSPRHRQALRVAWGVDDGPPPDRFQVGMATLSLFAAAGVAKPTLCMVDDAHWLDPESFAVLTFVARRLTAESTGLVLASRESSDDDAHFAGIDRLVLKGLDKMSAVELLRCCAPEIVDPLVATHIVEATGGNPLALVDLAHELDIRRHADPSAQDLIPVGRRLETHYLREIRCVDEEVQRWLAIAAAAASPDIRLITVAADAEGLPAGCPAEASRAGFVSFGETVHFRHPLVRSVVYSATPGEQRRKIHAGLAAAAAALGLHDLQAWHSAEATAGLDDNVADALERSAARASRRGGRLSAARLLSRAAELTASGSMRNGRLLSAAEAASEAGAAHLASQYLDRVHAAHLDDVQRGRLTRVRSSLALFLADPDMLVRAASETLNAAACFHGADADSEQRALLQAFEIMLVSENLTEGTDLPEMGRRLKAGAGEGFRGDLLRGISALILQPFDDAVPVMRTALDTLFGLGEGDLIECGFIGFVFTTALFDVTASERFLDRLATAARDRGALRVLDSVLWVRSLFEIDRGNPSAAGTFVSQVRELRRASGYDAENVVNVSFLVWTGLPTDQVEAISDIIGSTGFGGVQSAAQLALAIREIAEGRYNDAYERLKHLVAQPFLQVTDHMLADYVEAALRSDHLDDAHAAGTRLSLLAEATGEPWIVGLDARCRALLADDAHAEDHFVRAIEHLGKVDVPGDLGRGHLLYGEWLRRRKRRRDARAQLRRAAEIFDRVDAPAFRGRARGELAATGERPHERAVVGGVELSPQEVAVARLAADGATNAEIAATLFISTNTVDYHLRKVFGKLGVSSRRQLAERFAPPH
ncbi:LuxR C-terminal-related transcriptional regulator [Mycobacterium sp. 236(2023)]|nr:helix-turn-helix transcriptional regulator [Mycobacterium sp. 236(2023)]MDG4666505.1 LuxR C-terminal-related transcriptional regulator [Mycobacterium sp. 236(2023)]